MGIPVSCEVDIYGALSEFIGTVVSDDVVTLLDINNTVPSDIYEEDIKADSIIQLRIHLWASIVAIQQRASFHSVR